MARSVSKTIYTFKEQSNDIQEKVLNNMREYNLDYDWYSYIYMKL